MGPVAAFFLKNCMKSGGFWKEQEEASILVKNNEEAQRRKEMKKKRKNNVKIAYPPGRGLLMMSQISRAETDGHFFFFFENLKKNLKRPIRLLHSSKRRLFFTAEKSCDRLKFWISTKKWRCVFFRTKTGNAQRIGWHRNGRRVGQDKQIDKWRGEVHKMEANWIWTADRRRFLPSRSYFPPMTIGGRDDFPFSAFCSCHLDGPFLLFGRRPDSWPDDWKKWLRCLSVHSAGSGIDGHR